ncbi:MAG TPA: DUF222 domain-containing protein [Propionicimonas sp.]|nr:DUF222 domain-containing protein [Propionicimonas sp.]
MAQGVDERTGSDQLAVIGAACDALFHEPVGVLTGREQLDRLLESLRLGARLQAWQAQLAATIDATGVAWQEHGSSTATWLADAVNLTRREAGRLIAAGQGLARFPLVAEAAGSGTVLPGQAEAITAVLDDLPDDFPSEVVTEAQQMLVGFAASHNSAELRRLTSHLVQILDPETAEAREAARLDREHRLAMRNRHLTFSYDHHGSVELKGSLPLAEAEPFIRIIDAYTASLKRGIERLDPRTEHVTPAMRRADALLAMVNRHSQESLAPSHGGDRPRIVITLPYDRLLADCIDAGLVGTGDKIDAGTARRLLCDADLLPAVLGGPSQLLDVGRTQRRVTPAIRAALDLRDGGCVFPGCNTPPRDCEAHHRRPWWAGGPTSLENLVLLCAHHHGIVEPGHDPTTDRWCIELNPDGIPWVIPPTRVDPNQRPRLHARFHTRQKQGDP